jgi:hypothetical protein
MISIQHFALCSLAAIPDYQYEKRTNKSGKRQQRLSSALIVSATRYSRTSAIRRETYFPKKKVFKKIICHRRQNRAVHYS